jgi:hypothetical protein
MPLNTNVDSNHKVHVVAKIKGSQYEGEKWNTVFTLYDENTQNIVVRVIEDFVVKNENTVQVSIPVPQGVNLQDDVLFVAVEQVAHDFGVLRTINPVLKNNMIDIDLADSR